MKKSDSWIGAILLSIPVLLGGVGIFSATLGILADFEGDPSLLFKEILWPRFLQIVTVPLRVPDLAWSILPLFAATTLMILYFGRWKTEKLGWNTAFGNNISLFFVMASLLQEMVHRYQWTDLIDFSQPLLIKLGPPVYQWLFVLFLGFETLVLMYVNYYHKIPEKLSFFISSTLPVNGTALLSILIIKGKIPLDRITLLSSGVFFLAFWALFTVVKQFVRPSKGVKAVLTRQKRERIERQIAVREETKKRIKGFMNRIFNRPKP